MPAFWRRKMTIRRLWVLVQGLPRESLVAKVIDGERAEWTLDTMILAKVHNVLMLANADPKKLSKSDLITPPWAGDEDGKPVTMPRPTPPEERGEQKGWQDLDKLFGA